MASSGTTLQSPRPEVVPTAWAADGEAPYVAYRSGASAAVAAAAAAAAAPCDLQASLRGGTGPAKQRASSAGAQPHLDARPGSAGQQQQMPSQSSSGTGSGQLLKQRGPATGIRDSLTTSVLPRRNESPGPEYSQPQARAGSRDPSPKGQPLLGSSSRRNDSPSMRGESPMRPPSRPSRASSPGPGRIPASSTSSNPGPQSFGFHIGNVRTSTNPGSTGSGPQRGMGAFRSGGPVRAKADLLGDTGGSMRRGSRPNTAPPPGSASARSGSSKRPASPTGQPLRSNSSSRPPSPQGHRSTSAPSPSRSSGQAQRQYPSSHLRRAPSPTPAFNQAGRNASPSKPRWRA